MSETNREDGTTDEGSSTDPTPGDPTSGSSDWQPRSWEAPGSASSDQDEPNRSDSQPADADLTQEVGTDSTQHLPDDAPAPQQDVPDLSVGTALPPPPMPYPAPGQSEGSPVYPPPGQPTAYGAGAYPPPPPAPGPGAPPVPPAPGAYGAGPASPYGDPNAPYGAPPPAYYQQAPSQTNNSALVLTILSGIGIFACCGTTIVSLVLGILGITKQASDPAQSAKLTKWGWIAFAVGLVLAVVGFIAYIAGMIALAPELYIEPD